MRFGRHRDTKSLGEQVEEPNLITVKMYDYATYMLLFDDKMYCDLTNEDTPEQFKLNKQQVAIERTKNESGQYGKLDHLDADTRKILVFSQ